MSEGTREEGSRGDEVGQEARPKVRACNSILGRLDFIPRVMGHQGNC